MASGIRCPICNGSKMHPHVKDVPCGACLGTGCSTAPWDQPRKGTTVGVTWEDMQRIGVQERTVGYRLDEIQAALVAFQAVNGLTERTKVLPDLRLESPGTVSKDHRGRQKVTGILISWANLAYAERLELDRQEIASQGAQS